MNIKRHRRALVVLAVLAAFAALWPAVAQQASPQAAPSRDPLVFKTGIADPSNTVLALYMARSAGLDTAQGLSVDILDMNGGSRGAEELQAGRIDVMQVGLSSVIKVNQSGGDLRLIGSLSNVMRFTFFSASRRRQRGRSQGRHYRHQHGRLGERFRGHARFAKARP